MDTSSLIAESVANVIKEVVKGPIVFDGKIAPERLNKHRMRAQALVASPPEINAEPNEGPVSPLIDGEVQHCAAVIVAAFLNPISVDWDYNRFSESRKKRETGKFFAPANLGIITKPATVVDIHGKILLWYLPSLLLPYRVEELNRVTMRLKNPLCDSIRIARGSDSWRLNDFTSNGEDALFGAGKLSISIGKFQLAQSRLVDNIYISPNLRKRIIQEWLESLNPIKPLLDEVLQIVHPEFWSANSKTTSLLLENKELESLTWPTVYPGMDVIANRLSPKHWDTGGGVNFYDHLLSLGQDHNAKLRLHDFDADFAYKPGTSVLFSGKVLAHEVGEWEADKERIVIAHYAKDDVQDRLGVERPFLPTQMKWWSAHS